MENEVKEVKNEATNEELANNVENELNVDKLDGKAAKKMLKEVLAENAALKAESLKNKDAWYRTAADFDNFKKRNADTRINAYKDGKADVITKILVIGDSLDRALSMQLDDKTREGIELTARNFADILKSLDVVAINPVGEKFDPLTQEAIMKVPTEEGEEEGNVKQVFLKGYKLGEKVIRYAQVVVIG